MESIKFYTSTTSNIPTNQPSVQFINQLDEPPLEILSELGRTVFLFAQLEYYLLVVFKRAIPGASLPEVIDQRGGDSLGALLNGVTNRGEEKAFDGLRRIAEGRNETLRSIKAQLDRADALVAVRRKYVHGGFARRMSDEKWVFIKSGKETSEAAIVEELGRTSAEIKAIITEIQEKIPTPKP